MTDLSVKGVARRFLSIMGDFDVVGAIFGVPAISGTVSLRSRLETVARRQHTFEVDECIYGWTAAYQQTWTHVLIRIRLIPSNGLSDVIVEGMKLGWKSGIETTWNNKWACVHTGELPCRLSFEVRWVSGNPHHTVDVLPGSGETVMTTWHEVDSGAVAAHEFGHMLGNVDEYVDSECPDRSPVNTGTVMDDNSPNVPARLMQRFADSIGSNLASP